MGINRDDGGYSASVEGYLLVNGERIRLAKTNALSLVFTRPLDLPVGTTGDLVVIVDGNRESKRIELPNGASAAQSQVDYRVLIPF